MTLGLDRTLWEAWRTGDESAGRKLLFRHAPLLYRFFRDKTTADVTDLAHVTLLSCLEGRGPRPGSSFRAWLLMLARETLLHQRRAARLRPPAMPDDDATQVSGGRPALARAMRELSLDARLAVELHYWEKLTLEEVAVVLQLTGPTAAAEALARARKALEAHLRHRLPPQAGILPPPESELGT